MALARQLIKESGMIGQPATVWGESRSPRRQSVERAEQPGLPRDREDHQLGRVLHDDRRPEHQATGRLRRLGAGLPEPVRLHAAPGRQRRIVPRPCRGTRASLQRDAEPVGRGRRRRWQVSGRHWTTTRWTTATSQPTATRSSRSSVPGRAPGRVSLPPQRRTNRDLSATCSPLSPVISGRLMPSGKETPAEAPAMASETGRPGRR